MKIGLGLMYEVVETSPTTMAGLFAADDGRCHLISRNVWKCAIQHLLYGAGWIAAVERCRGRNNVSTSREVFLRKKTFGGVRFGVGVLAASFFWSVGSAAAQSGPLSRVVQKEIGGRSEFQAWTGPVLDARTFGARCDGRGHDDAGSIQAAIDAVPETGGIVQLPAGVCWLSSELLVNRNSLWIRGSGRGATTLSGSKATNLLHFGGASTVFHSAVSDVALQGGFRCLWIDEGSSSTIVKDLLASECTIGIQINGDVHSRPERPTISSYVSNVEVNNPTSIGLYVYEASEIYLSQILVDGNKGTASAAVLFDSFTDAVYAERLNLLASKICLLVQDTIRPSGPSKSRPSHIFMDTVLGDSAHNPSSPESAVGVYLKSGWQIFLTKAWASGSGGMGMIIGDDTDEISLIDPSFILNGLDGLRLVGSSQRQSGHVQIVGGRSLSNSYVRPGTHDGIVVEGRSNFSIIGHHAYNDLEQVMGYGPHQRHGISILPGSSDRYVIMGNILQGNLQDGLLDEAVGEHRTVLGNQ